VSVTSSPASTINSEPQPDITTNVELFNRYALRFRPHSPLVSLAGGGGLSGARLWRYRAEQGEILLRAWPLDGPKRRHIERVHHWLSFMDELGFVPVPFRDRANQSVQEWHGLVWEITPWMSGAADPSVPPAAEHLRAAFAGLAAFHQRLAGEQSEGASVGLRQRHDEIGRLVAGGFDSLEKAIRHPADHRPSSQQTALAWLAIAREVAPAVLSPLARASGELIRLQPVLRDARPEHFLFEDHRLSGLVDFGAMGVESVAADLARLMGEWLDDDLEARSEALQSYERLRPLGSDEARLIAAFEATAAVLIGERWVRWHYIENRRFDDPQAAPRGIDRGRLRLERLRRDLAGSRVSF
jgi:Phosphotransferase enzyme family